MKKKFEIEWDYDMDFTAKELENYCNFATKYPIKVTELPTEYCECLEGISAENRICGACGLKRKPKIERIEICSYQLTDLTHIRFNYLKDKINEIIDHL